MNRLKSPEKLAFYRRMIQEHTLFIKEVIIPHRLKTEGKDQSYSRYHRKINHWRQILRNHDPDYSSTLNLIRSYFKNTNYLIEWNESRGVVSNNIYYGFLGRVFEVKNNERINTNFEINIKKYSGDLSWKVNIYLNYRNIYSFSSPRPDHYMSDLDALKQMLEQFKIDLSTKLLTIINIFR